MENDLGVAGGWVSVVGCNDMFVAREASLPGGAPSSRRVKDVHFVR